MSIDVPAADVVAVAVLQSPVSDFPAGGSRWRPPVGAPVAATDDGSVVPAVTAGCEVLVALLAVLPTHGALSGLDSYLLAGGRKPWTPRPVKQPVVAR